MLLIPVLRGVLKPGILPSCLALMMLTSCAKAGDPEQFRADPLLFDDFTLSLPTYGSSGGLNYEIIQGFAVLEGDILLGKVDSSGHLRQQPSARGLGRNDAFGRWPNGVVPYLAPTRNSAIQQKNIEDAIAHWMERSTITFVERTDSNKDQYPHYLRFDSSNSCASYVGMQGGEQSIMVADACSMGSIVHEIGHALGLFHEHTRPDRDNFAQIDWAQIVPGKEINFDILTAGVQNMSAYDYGSIMHYGEYFFSATGQRTIIVPDGITVGQRDALSTMDASSVDQMYATDLALLQPTFDTRSDGLEIGISIANQGNLGAHQLRLDITAADGAQWQGVSQDSGWECNTAGSDLQCNRDTMNEQTESRFSLLIAGSGISSDAIGMTLSSRTRDTNTENNFYNPEPSQPDNDAPETDSIQLVFPDSAPNSTAQPVSMVPVAAAAQITPNTTASDSPSAASDHGALGILLATILAWRRRAMIHHQLS